MKKSFNGILLLSLAVTPDFAAAFLEGNFAADDQAALFHITAHPSDTVTIGTFSHAGRTVNSTIIPAGGFAPTAFVFDNIGDVLSNGSGSRVGTSVADGLWKTASPASLAWRREPAAASAISSPPSAGRERVTSPSPSPGRVPL